MNSGTPEAPEAYAVRAFLRRFLGDPRVVELPRALWLPMLYGLILPLRPRRVAPQVPAIWSASGSPLRELIRAAARASSPALLAQRMLAPLSVEVGMLYSPPTCGPRSSGCATAARSASSCCRCFRSTAARPPGPSSIR